MLTVSEGVEELTSLLECDSNIRLCMADRNLAFRIMEEEGLPSSEELELLVMGGEDGEIPEELVERFPRLDQFLGSFF